MCKIFLYIATLAIKSNLRSAKLDSKIHRSSSTARGRSHTPRMSNADTSDRHSRARNANSFIFTVRNIFACTGCFFQTMCSNRLRNIQYYLSSSSDLLLFLGFPFLSSPRVVARSDRASGVPMELPTCIFGVRWGEEGSLWRHYHILVYCRAYCIFVVLWFERVHWF